MMDDSKAVDGVQQILEFLIDEELFNLAATITHGLLKNKIETRKDAVEAVIKYSPDLQSILKRKVITRDILFNYLHLNDVQITLPAIKSDLIHAVCVYWNLKSQETLASTSKENTYCFSSNLLPVDIDTLAVKFSEWFYTMMNKNEPIGQEHFWNDSKLELNLISDAQNIKEEIHDNAEEIVKKLFETKMKHALYFNPNFLNEGTQGRMDRHGLVIVLACGTLHSNNNCVGIFEQIFHIMRDPCSSNNWKIKNTQLNLRSKSDVQSPPRLCDGNLSSQILNLSDH